MDPERGSVSGLVGGCWMGVDVDSVRPTEFPRGSH